MRLMGEGVEKLPEGFEVHHIDYNRRNNCPMNLVMMEGRIHWALARRERGEGGRFCGRGGSGSGANAEVDRLVVEMVAEEMRWPVWVVDEQGEGKENGHAGSH